MTDSGWPPVGSIPIRRGDLVLVASGAGQGILSSLIRWRTGSAFSHAQLVVSDGYAPGLDWQVLEVGWRIRVAPAAEALGAREFVVWRPSRDTARGALVAADARSLVEQLHARGEDRYPWWKLGAYALGSDTAARLLRSGPRQVCSVMSVYPWIARGLFVWRWRDDRHGFERLDDPCEVRSITPGDLQRCAIEQGWARVYETPGAPVGV